LARLRELEEKLRIPEDQRIGREEANPGGRRLEGKLRKD